MMVNMKENQMANRASLRYLISIPFWALRRLVNWSFSEPVDPGDLQYRYPKVQFRYPENISVRGKGFLLVQIVLLLQKLKSQSAAIL